MRNRIILILIIALFSCGNKAPLFKEITVNNLEANKRVTLSWYRENTLAVVSLKVNDSENVVFSTYGEVITDVDIKNDSIIIKGLKIDSRNIKKRVIDNYKVVVQESSDEDWHRIYNPSR